MNRLLITICGRAGSKGFKNKNLKMTKIIKIMRKIPTLKHKNIIILKHKALKIWLTLIRITIQAIIPQHKTHTKNQSKILASHIKPRLQTLPT